MALPLPPEMVRRALEEFTEQPWIWFWKLTADRTVTATTVFRLVRYPEPLTFDTVTWSPFPLEVGDIRQTAQSDLIDVELRCSNVTRELAFYVDKGRGFRGLPATAYLVHMDHLAAGHAVRFDFTVGTVSLDRSAAVFRLNTPNYFQRLAPQDRFTRDRCRRAYKGPGCGYLGDLPSCAHTLADCMDHGADEAANNLQVIHPERFGACPGIPRRLSR